MTTEPVVTYVYDVRVFLDTPDEVIPLTERVTLTEGHPMPSWRAAQRGLEAAQRLWVHGKLAAAPIGAMFVSCTTVERTADA